MEKLRDKRLREEGHALQKKRSKYRDPISSEAEEGEQKAKGSKPKSGGKKTGRLTG